LALSVYREVAGWRISRAGGGSAFYVRQQDTTKHMNTTKILNLTKTLRALSMLFMSLSVLIIAIPLSSILGVHTVQGVHAGDFGWSGWIRFALLLVLIGSVLFGCYMFSRQKRGRLATVLLWSAALVSGVYAAMSLFSLLYAIQHGCS